MNGKQVIKQLESRGWSMVRVKGSHHMMQKDGKTVPIPIHGSTDIGSGLLAKIERQTGVKLQ
jgi:predicted RNA binding protein YcfA (HicA-like mRNA interferase family)